MKTIFLSSLVLTASVAFAADIKAPVPDSALTNLNAIERFNLKHFGGKVAKPNSQHGRILFVNSQKAIKNAGCEKIIAELHKAPRFDIRVDITNAVMPKMSQLKRWREDNVANVVVFIIDDSDLPPTLLAAEEHWGLVNVAGVTRLELEEKKAEYYVHALLTRVVAVLCGGSASQFPSNVMGITALGDIDCIEGVFIPIDTINKMQQYLPRIGVTPTYIANYDTAVRAGWAPKPVNQYQQRIWDKIHKLPTNPIKIKPETKKVAE